MMTTIPVLGFLGAWLKNSTILLLMVASIVALVIIIIFSKKSIPPDLYAFAIFIVMLALVLHIEFISKYLVGWDVFGEYYIFRLAKTNLSWDPNSVTSDISNLPLYNSMLSLTILPAIYATSLNIQEELIFKVLYPLLFSLVPVTLYVAYQQRFGKLTAFLSATFFATLSYGQETRRIMVAGFFLALIVFLLLNRNITPRKRLALMTIFTFSLIVSHYSTTYIYLHCITIGSILTYLTMKYRHVWASRESRAITNGLIVLSFAITLFWYAYVSPYPGITLWDLMSKISNSFPADILNPTARGEVIETLSPGSLADLPLTYKITFVLGKIPYFFMLAGTISLLRNCKEKRRGWEYAWITVASVLLLIMIIVVPHLEAAFLTHRFLMAATYFVAPTVIIGGVACLSLIWRAFKAPPPSHVMTTRVVGIILMINLLFQIGFVNEFTGHVEWGTRSINFTKMKTNSNYNVRAKLYDGYVPEQEVFSARWIPMMVGNDQKIYADSAGRDHALRGYGMKITGWNNNLLNGTEIDSNAFIYMRQINSQGLAAETKGSTIFQRTDFSRFLKDTNKVYSNGDSEVYLATPNSPYLIRVLIWNGTK
jgi:uncharacterized membrane protein